MPNNQNKKRILLEVSHLNKTFRNGRNIVNANNDISFEIPYGKVVGLIGESGSGKTTVGRTIMNLHAPDSGSIKLDGKEIGGTKLSKLQKKYLYNNVQMIFQDPYSSLNSQKNIMTIVAESLKAKKIDKEIYKGYVYNRDEILAYYENELKEKFFNEYWDYRKFANFTALEGLKRVNEELDDFTIDKKKNMLENFTRFNNKIYDIKSVANYQIIGKLDDLIESTIFAWKERQEAIKKDTFTFKDEIDLQKAKKELHKAERIMEASDETYKLIDKKESIENKIIEKNNIYKANQKNILINYKNIIKNIKLRKISLANKKMESLSVQSFNLFDRRIKECEMKIFLIKKFKKIKIDVATTEIFNKVDNKFKLYEKIEKSARKRIKLQLIKELNINTKDNAVNLKVEKEVKLEFQEFAISLVKYYTERDKALLMHNKSLKVMEDSIAQLVEKIKISKSEDQKRDKEKLRSDVELKKQNVNHFQKIFNNELIKFKKDSAKKLELQSLEMNKLVDVKMKQILSLRKQVELKEKIIIKSIKGLGTFNEGESENIKAAIKRIDTEYKKSIDLNKRLDLEIKVNMQALDKIKYLYNIKSSFSLFKNRKLKNVFIRQEVFDTLLKVGLNKAVAYRYPHEFSGGMRQRVGIARALISRPKLIIADEPIAALDLSIQAQIVNLLLELKEKENISLLFIAHDLSMIEYNSDEVLIMHLGRIVEYGDAKEIFARPVHPYTKNLMSSIPKLSDIKEKFEDQKFNPDYLKEYDNFNDPEYFEVRQGHFVLASKGQIDVWKK